MSSAKTSYDVIVVGLGGTGSAAAYHLAARGCRVCGIPHATLHLMSGGHFPATFTNREIFDDLCR